MTRKAQCDPEALIPEQIFAGHLAVLARAAAGLGCAEALSLATMKAPSAYELQANRRRSRYRALSSSATSVTDFFASPKSMVVPSA